MGISQFISDRKLSVKLLLYRKIYIPYRAWRIRKKKTINVLFVLTNLGAWKSELLYNAMLAHPRFNPVIVITRNSEEDDRDNIKSYCNAKGYHYNEGGGNDEPMWNRFHPDIILYQKPYGGEFVNNLKSLMIYVHYGFHGTLSSWSVRNAQTYNSWQVYFENDVLAEQYGRMLYPVSKNAYATGIPPMDELVVDKESVADEWKYSGSKKRIIYAPHHSMDKGIGWQTSTFLENGEYILELAEKYSDKVQWAFKPHPILRGKLEKLWGKEKTDSYYNRWRDAEWSQFESGKYLGLFLYSDAMIHDCGSFVEEYHYTGNPVMYLVRKEGIHEEWNDTMTEAFRLHYKGHSGGDIERFIQNVISGVDPMRIERMHFVEKHLMPPYGKTACENIIDCILDSKAAKRMRARKF